VHVCDCWLCELVSSGLLIRPNTFSRRRTRRAQVIVVPAPTLQKQKDVFSRRLVHKSRIRAAFIFNILGTAGMFINVVGKVEYVTVQDIITIIRNVVQLHFVDTDAKRSGSCHKWRSIQDWTLGREKARYDKTMPEEAVSLQVHDGQTLVKMVSYL
jgi:hypothetical protein